MTHLDDETLSALIDSELAPPKENEARLHISACERCRGRLESLRDASAAFKRSGAVPLPVGLAARAKAKAAPASRGPSLLVAGAIASIAIFVFAVAGVALKKFMPNLFNNIQQMITGAASQMGSGDK